MLSKDDIRPYLVGKHNAVMTREQRHGLFQFLVFPYTPSRIMWTTEQDDVDALLVQ